MAAAMKLGMKNGLSYSRMLVYRQRNISMSCLQKCQMSSDSSDGSDPVRKLPQVGMSKDGRTLVCWHPEPEHPYEHTRPMEYNSKELAEGQSVLKEEVIRAYDTQLRPEGPSIQELSNLTYTTKHQWYPNTKKKYRKQIPVGVDREHV